MAATDFCAACGATADLCEHHLRPRSHGGAGGPTITLCEPCHGVAHEVDRQDIAALTRQALRGKKARGLRTGQVPFGFSLADDGDHLLPVPGELEIIDELRARRAGGETLQGIADDLNAREVPTKNGGRWWARTVANIATAQLPEVAT